MPAKPTRPRSAAAAKATKTKTARTGTDRVTPTPASIALEVLSEAMVSPSAFWPDRIQAAAVVLSLRDIKAAAPSREIKAKAGSARSGKPKVEKPEALTPVEIKALCGEMLGQIDEVMASHAGAAMDYTENASDPGGLLEQPAPLQHGAGGTPVG